VLFETSSIFIARGAEVKLYPNPTEGDLVYVEFEQLGAGRYTIEVVNQFGQAIRSEELSLAEAQSNYRLELIRGKTLAAGVYYLRIYGEDTEEELPFIVK